MTLLTKNGIIALQDAQREVKDTIDSQYRVVLAACHEAGRIDIAVLLFEMMKEIENKVFVVDDVITNIVLGRHT
jgi:hypothetical protein